MNGAYLRLFFDRPFSSQRLLLGSQIPGVWEMPKNEQEAKLREFIAPISLDEVREKIAAGFVRLTAIERLIPDAYAEFRPVTCEGIFYFLSRLSEERLKELCIQQFLLDADVEPGERLLVLVNKIPVLFKLGQIIARNHNVPGEFRDWLTRLEDEAPGFSDPTEGSESFSEIKKKFHEVDFFGPGETLGEASVGRISDFPWRTYPEDSWTSAVGKVLRPHVEKHLPEELDLLIEMGDWFENRQDLYILKDFPFKKILSEIRQGLLREIDFLGEQRNLEIAFEQYKDLANCRVPRVHQFSSGRVTVMDKMTGESLKKLSLTAMQKRAVAKELFRAFVLWPLFSREEKAIFHGDPHAGNFLISIETLPKVAIIDWSQAGFLERRTRSAIVQIVLGFELEEPTRVLSGIQKAIDPAPENSPVSFSDLLLILDRLMSDDKTIPKSLLGKVNYFIDELGCLGVMFPSDLLLFRKAFFTLEGVINQLEPKFPFDAEMKDWIRDLVQKELLQRSWRFFMPFFDRPQAYKSLISNLDLHSFFGHKLIKSGKEMLRIRDSIANCWFPEKKNGINRKVFLERGLRLRLSMQCNRRKLP